MIYKMAVLMIQEDYHTHERRIYKVACLLKLIYRADNFFDVYHNISSLHLEIYNLLLFLDLLEQSLYMSPSSNRDM